MTLTPTSAHVLGSMTGSYSIALPAAALAMTGGGSPEYLPKDSTRKSTAPACFPMLARLLQGGLGRLLITIAPFANCTEEACFSIRQILFAYRTTRLSYALECVRFVSTNPQTTT